MELEPFKSRIELLEYVYDKIKTELGCNPSQLQIEQLAKKMFIRPEQLIHFLENGSEGTYQPIALQALLAYFHTPVELAQLSKIAFPAWSINNYDENWKFLRNTEVLESLIHSEIRALIILKKQIKYQEIEARFGDLMTQKAVYNLIDAGYVIRQVDWLMPSKTFVRLPSIDANHQLLKIDLDLIPQNIPDKYKTSNQYKRYNQKITKLQADQIEDLTDKYTDRLWEVSMKNRELTDTDIVYQTSTALIAYSSEHEINPIFIPKEEKIDIVSKVVKNFAHDSQEPFRQISEFLHHLEDCDDLNTASEILHKYSHSIKTALKKVNYTISDMMSLGSNLVCEKTPIVPELIIESALYEVFNEKIFSKFDFEYDFQHTKQLLGDSEKLKRVVLNILQNVIDATKNKDSKIWFKTKNRQINGINFVEICIGNNNSYIPHIELKKIFEPFYSIEHKLSKGLGLAIANKIIHAHGGAIRCESIESVGVEFHFYLPMADSAVSTYYTLPKSSSDIIPSANLSNPEFEDNTILFESYLDNYYAEFKVVVIDDDEVYCKMVESFLQSNLEKHSQLKLLKINSFENTLYDIIKFDPHFILLDVDLGIPEFDGFKLTKQLREHHFKGKICIHSNRGLFNFLIEKENHGFDYIVPKPISKHQLFSFFIPILAEQLDSRP
ncbi:hybrid sensor histidine kinase/response regulator [Dolichospermum sp. ST_sed1]|nr:hybrid sensor histidine kinase/response regulator [Dolichospermum sp. ST_sed1]